VSSYTGKAGSVIRIKATDNFKVASVLVKIADADGTQIEVGEAIQDKIDDQYWLYLTNEFNELLPGSMITVIASDLPMNTTIMENRL